MYLKQHLEKDFFNFKQILLYDLKQSNFKRFTNFSITTTTTTGKPS